MQYSLTIQWLFPSLLSPLLSLLGAALLEAQINSEEIDQRPLLGIYGEVGYGYAHSDFLVFPGSAECGVFNGGTMEKWELGSELAFPFLFSDRLGLSARIGVGISTSHFAVEADPFVLVDGETEELVEFAHEYRLATSRLASRIEVLADLHLNQQFQLHLGGGAGLEIVKRQSQTDYITDDFYRFAEGRRERTMFREEPPPSLLSFNGTASLSTRLPIGSEAQIMPRIGVRLATRPSVNVPATLDAIGTFGISILTRLGPGPQKEELPQLPSPPLIPLTASINVSSPSAEGINQGEPIVQVVETFAYDTLTKEWQINRQVYPPTLLIDRHWESSEGIMAWEVTFEYGDLIIGRASSRKSQELSELNWKIADESAADSIRPLHVKVVVTDSSGATVEATDSINIRIRYAHRVFYQQGRRSLWTLVEPEESSSDEIDQKIFRDVLEATQPGDRIVLQPREGLSEEDRRRATGRLYKLGTALHDLLEQREKTGIDLDIFSTPQISMWEELRKEQTRTYPADHLIEIIVLRR